MKFVDRVQIEIRSGDGGRGAVAFRREKFQEKGGPSGGDGGRGGSVLFETDLGLSTLLDFHYRPLHHARNGQGGMGSDCNGRNAEDLILRVPAGTLVFNAADQELLVDLDAPGATWIGAKGGRGGLGNMNFATSTRQAPRFAQPGEPGEHKVLLLELKLLADIGLVGFPNAGKSSFISKVSKARPKVADYPFTTLTPHLGMVAYKDRQSFVVADIPGLLPGAADGHGLGHQFLRHIERCRALLHIVDMGAAAQGRDPFEDYNAIRKELRRYRPALARRPQIVAANKIDLPEARTALPAFTRALGRRGVQVFPISAATGEGIPPVLDACAKFALRPRGRRR